jgi:hypothetical protein
VRSLGLTWKLGGGQEAIERPNASELLGQCGGGVRASHRGKKGTRSLASGLL